jgi:peptide deformylase
MAIRRIITPVNPILRHKAKKVTTYGPALKVLVEDMIDTIREASGVGLAAPQVAVSQRVIVVEYAPEPDEGQEPESP